MDNVTKVTFPAFSRMQDSPRDLQNSLTRSIFFICYLVFPSTVGMVILSPVLIQIVPGYAKWEPALIPLMLISINTLFASVTTQLTNALNATGRIKITFFLMIGWTVLTWLSVPYLSATFGVNGAAAGYALVGSSSALAIIIARRFVKFSLLASVVKPALATIAMGAALIIGRNLLAASLSGFSFLIILGAITYGLSSFILIGANLIHDVRHSIKTIFARQ